MCLTSSRLVWTNKEINLTAIKILQLSRSQNANDLVKTTSFQSDHTTQLHKTAPTFMRIIIIDILENRRNNSIFTVVIIMMMKGYRHNLCRKDTKHTESGDLVFCGTFETDSV